MRLVRAGVVGVIALAVLLTGCRAPGSGGPTVVTSFYPLYFLADDIAGRYNDVVDLTPPGVEPHEYELTVRQVAQIDLARVGFFEKGVAPSIDQAMANDSPGHQLDVTSVVDLLSPTAGSAGEATSDDKDPHFWLDPSLMATAAEAFAATMADADPAHAAYYRKRGAHLARQLHRLDRDYARTLATCRVRTLVVSHDAFEYLGRRYHLDVVPDRRPRARLRAVAAAPPRPVRPDPGAPRDDRVLRDPGLPRPGALAGRRPRHLDRRPRPDRGPDLERPRTRRTSA